MSLWYCIPSCRPTHEATEVVKAWQAKGFKVAVMREGVSIPCDLEIKVRAYQGLPFSQNFLINAVMNFEDTSAEWFVIGGDDYWPIQEVSDANKVAKQCYKHFKGTMGVMQPTGDRWGNGYIDTAAASAWIGREFVEKTYSGKGPFYEGYFHYYSDAELQEVALKYRCFWQNQRWTQVHQHWSRQTGSVCPEFLTQANIKLNEDADTFKQRKILEFPGA